MLTCESCQVLIEAALSKNQHVPQGSFGGANAVVYTLAVRFEARCTV